MKPQQFGGFSHMAAAVCASEHTLEAESEVAGSAPSAVAARTTTRLLRCRGASICERPACVLRRVLRGAAEDSISSTRFAGTATVRNRIQFHTRGQQRVAESYTRRFRGLLGHEELHALNGNLACRKLLQIPRACVSHRTFFPVVHLKTQTSDHDRCAPITHHREWEV